MGDRWHEEETAGGADAGRGTDRLDGGPATGHGGGTDGSRRHALCRSRAGGGIGADSRARVDRSVAARRLALSGLAGRGDELLAVVLDDQSQRSQFILVNSTKPLPKGLIHELLPATRGTLPVPLQLRRFPTTLLYRLNYAKNSPFYRVIQTPTNPDGVVKDNSVIKMLENSLSDGALYRHHRDPETGAGDEDAMLAVLKNFWTAVRQIFSDAWGKPPRHSRLMHGVGIVSIGFLMDAICDRYLRIRTPTTEDFMNDLEQLKDVCKWTNGYWNFGPQNQRKWNELQNTSRDIQLLTNYLLFEYKARVWSRAERQEA